MRKIVLVEILLIGILMIILILSTVATPWSVLAFLDQKRYLLSLGMSIFIITIGTLFSLLIHYFFGYNIKSLSNQEAAYEFIYPMIIPIFLFLIVGIQLSHYMSYALCTLFGLMMYVLYSYIKRKRSHVSWTRLYLVSYSLMMSSLWFLSIIFGYTINY